jgi:hypothetical protein
LGGSGEKKVKSGEVLKRKRFDKKINKWKK